MSDDEVTLDGPDCAQGEATVWLLAALGGLAGLAVTAGWIGRTAWTVASRPESWAWARSVW